MSTRTLPPGVFKPVCPECKYDLSGLPDGCCPECGTAFTRAGLLERAAARKSVISHVVTTILTYLAVFSCPACVWPLAGGGSRRGADTDAATVLILISGALAIASLARWASLGKAIRGLMFLSPPLLLMATAMPLLGWVGASFAMAMLATGLAGGVSFGESTFAIRRFMTIAEYSTGLLLLGMSTPIAVHALLELRVGDTWSQIPDPRPGQVHEQYPLTNTEALIGSSLLMLLAVVLTVRVLNLLRRAARRQRILRALTPPPASPPSAPHPENPGTGPT